MTSSFIRAILGTSLRVTVASKIREITAQAKSHDSKSDSISESSDLLTSFSILIAIDHPYRCCSSSLLSVAFSSSCCCLVFSFIVLVMPRNTILNYFNRVAPAGAAPAPAAPTPAVATAAIASFDDNLFFLG